MKFEDQKSLIWSVIVFTFAIFALVVIVIIGILALCFPKNYGDLLFTIGLKNTALNAYEHHYQTTNNIDDLYLLLNKSIVAKNDEFIVKTYENFSRQANYKTFVENVEKVNINNCVSSLEMLYLSNEDNYLKGKYVVALKNFKGNDLAFEYANSELNKFVVTKSADRINFVFGYYINSLKDASEFEFITTEVKNDIYNFYTNLYAIYNTEKVNLALDKKETYLVDKFNLLKLNYRLSDICYAMKSIDHAVGMERDLTDVDNTISELKQDFTNLL